MEYFDVLDNKRNNLNYTKIRGEALDENEYNQGAEIWIFNDEKLFLTKRSINKSHPSLWEVPGGCSKAGETTIDTIIREVKEEIGLNINKGDLNFLKTIIYKKQFVDVFKTTKTVLSVKLQLEEVSDYKFVNKNEFDLMIKKNMIVPSVIDRYESIKEYLNKDW